MNRIAMSTAASGLLRCIIGRATVFRDRILLTEILSIDWQSLIFLCERHQYDLRIPGPDSSSMSAGSAMDWRCKVQCPGPDRRGHRGCRAADARLWRVDQHHERGA